MTARGGRLDEFGRRRVDDIAEQQKVEEALEIYTFSGLGSKGFLFAPLCSEVLASLVLGEACPIPNDLLQKLSPKRFQKKVKPKKPYFKASE